MSLTKVLSILFIYFFYINFLILFIFIFGCVGSSLLRAGFLWLRQVGATLSCGVQASHCSGFSYCGARALGTRASVVVARGLSCSVACGIFPGQGSNPCPLHWQADFKDLALISSIFPIIFLVSISFIFAQIFISFLLLTLGFVCSSFSSS